MVIDLASLVISKIDELGAVAAAEYFGVCERSIYAWKKGEGLPSTEACQRALNDWTTINPPEAWTTTGKQVLILQPIYRSVNPLTHISLTRNYTLFGRDKVGFIPKLRTLIWEARNYLAEAALKTDSEFVIFVDDDMLLPFGNGPIFRSYGCDVGEPMASRVALSRIMSHPADKLIVGALAFGRHTDTLRAACSDGWDSAASNTHLVNCRRSRCDELRKVRWTGMAFTRIHRSVFERMKAGADEHFPEIKPSKPGRHYGYFTPYAQDQGEDASLCLRASKLGVQSYVDCGCVLGHVGDRVF